jgi:alkanesulfonate monooxygenase SsuD/methylene tetrahydromethanopterin reductase-like flavin-dependent oxidoreductase (luciferase family)
MDGHSIVSAPPRRFGLLMPMMGTGVDAASLIGELTEEAIVAESAGMDLVLVPEHHSAPDGALTDPISMCGWLLGRTSRLTVGTGVAIAALHHPVRLAEQGAILADASGGRFLLGIGAGYQPDDFSFMGVDIDRRRDDLIATVETVRRGWQGEEISPGRRLTPRPSQNHIPEVWIGAWSRWGVRTAAQVGAGWLVDPIRSLDEILDMTATYTEAAEKAHRVPRLLLMRHLWVAASNAEAERVYAPFVEPVYRYYRREGALPSDPAVPPQSLTIDGALRGRVICGDSARVTDELATLMAQSGAEGCIFALRHPSGPSHAQVSEAISQLCEEVIPALR